MAIKLECGKIIPKCGDCEYIRKLYDGCEIIQIHWKYGMSKDKKSNEILIIN